MQKTNQAKTKNKIFQADALWYLPFEYQEKEADDENIIYTFHCYAPNEFTHQQGVLQAGPLFYNRKMPYPTDDIERYRAYHRLHGNENAYCDIDKMDIEYLRKYLEEKMGGFGDKSKRFMFLYNRMIDVLMLVFERLKNEFSEIYSIPRKSFPA